VSRGPIRLWMVVHDEYPADVRVAREVRAARAAGLEVEVFATRGAEEASRELVDGVLVHRLPVTRRRGAGAVRFFAEYLSFSALAVARVAARAVRRRPDIVHVHNPPDFLIAAALLPRLLGARTVFDVHDLSSDMFGMRFGEGAASRLAGRVLRSLERLACLAADAVMTVHEPYRAELGRRGVDAAKVLVVLNSVDESVLPADPVPPVRDPFRIVYHGTVTPHYGLGVVIDAFARLPPPLADARLEILGGGDAVPELVARADRLGVGERVELTGVALPQVEVLRRVQGASVGVIPNLPSTLNRFALSTKLFEYVALGIPVVASDLPTIRAHFSDEELTFYRAGDAEGLAEALRRVGEDYDAALARSRAARERYRAEYAWPRQARSYVRLLELLAALAPDPARAAARHDA
jgi:glycosyltransferase involved in cell wall biosynthesis